MLDLADRSLAERWLASIAWLVARLPLGVLPWLGACLGWVAGTLLRIRRRHVDSAMRRAGLSTAHAAAMYCGLGTSVFEFLWMAGSSRSLRAYAHVDEESARLLRKAQERGRGVVLAASHTGNWDLAACRMAEDVEVVVVTKRLRVAWLDAFWQRTRARRGVSLTEGTGALGVAHEVLGRGGVVAMMIDQVPERTKHGVLGEFLGAPARVDRAAAVLAARAGAPLVVTAARRSTEGHVLEVLRVFFPPDRPSQRWIEETTLDATKALEDFVRRYPSAWLWMHRRWRIGEAS